MGKSSINASFFLFANHVWLPESKPTGRHQTYIYICIYQSYISGLCTMNHLRDGPPSSHPKICRTNNCALSPKCRSFCEASTLLKAQHHYRALSKKSPVVALRTPRPRLLVSRSLRSLQRRLLGKSIDRSSNSAKLSTVAQLDYALGELE